ncbi:MAG: glycogen/starch synthase [Simkaniaceae bacterium]|nr:glycogen/starch synthase [Simkaniaceae bacterium]
MRIIHVATELAPIAKVGGLADVVYGLSKELLRQGHDVSIILPFYPCLKHLDIKQFGEITIQEEGHRRFNRIFTSSYEGIRLFLIEEPRYFDRSIIYGEIDDNDRFIYFSLAAMEVLNLQEDPIDVLHVHDWPAALCIPLYCNTYAEEHLIIKCTVLTIHNIQHQGRCNIENLHKIGIASFYDFLIDPLNPRLANLLKGAITYADVVTTVSPSYLKEIQKEEMGFGLSALVNASLAKFYGILNGIDSTYWDPEHDPYLFETYNTHTLSHKKVNRRLLSAEIKLPSQDTPLFVAITRLASQKGPDSLYRGIQHVLDQGCQFILLGIPTQETEDLFYQLPKHPNLYIHLGYDERLAHLTYAAADYILIPSHFEPCGLTQMIAMQYGTIPIARRTGGLADTIKHQKTGYLFNKEEEFLPMIDQAIQGHPHFSFREEGMHEDFSWRRSAEKYLHLYQSILSYTQRGSHTAPKG